MPLLNAHLALALYKLAGKDFIPNLYIDVMIMIKNVLFCVAKAKVDDPDRGAACEASGEARGGKRTRR